MEEINYKELIPELEEWEEHNNLPGVPFEVDEWIGCVGNYEHAIGYLSIFWPDFYEYDGCIFVSSIPDEEVYQSWLKKSEGDKKEVEALLNHEHLVYLFQVGHLRPTEAQLKYIGNKLKEMWLAKAKSEFPSRNIAVELYEGDEDNLEGHQVTLFQNEHGS